YCLNSTKYLKEAAIDVQKRFSEAEQYLKELGDSTPVELTKWMHNIIVDTQINLITGQPTCALSSYYNSLLPPHLKKSLPQQSTEYYSKFTSNFLSCPF